MKSIFRKVSRLVRMCLIWLSSSHISLRTRLSYLFGVAVAVLRERLTKKKVVRYLGRPFYYDSPITPFLLLQYPEEIQKRIANNIAEPIRAVLDIGGNIGQFSSTFLALNPDLERIDIFEPNPSIFDLLEKNMGGSVDKAQCFNLGIGPDGPAEFYFTRGYSGVGSVISENARYRATSSLTTFEVQLVSDIRSATGTNEYDLVKVDVEGFEYEVIESIQGLSFRYLYIEITGPAKEKSHPTSELYAILREKFGPYEVRYQAPGDRNSTVFETLLEFVGD